MNILLTGGAGYIGSKLLTALVNNGHNVDVVDNLTYGYNPILPFIGHPKVDFYKSDITDPHFHNWFRLDTYDIIIPLAALVGMPLCAEYPNKAQEVNCGQIEWLIDTLNKRYLSPLILFPNTNSGYGSTSGTEACTEETPMNPISIYGKTKCAAENYIKDNYKNYFILRLATVFGCSPRPRLDLLVNDLAYKIYHNQPIMLYEGSFMRNFVHIDDVVDCFMWLINNYEAEGQYKITDKIGPHYESEVYNLGNDDINISKLDLVKLICRSYKKDFMKLVSMDNTTKDVDQRNYIVSSKKLNNAGFKAERSISRTLDELKLLYQLLPTDQNKMSEYYNI